MVDKNRVVGHFLKEGDKKRLVSFVAESIVVLSLSTTPSHHARSLC